MRFERPLYRFIGVVKLWNSRCPQRRYLSDVTDTKWVLKVVHEKQVVVPDLTVVAPSPYHGSGVFACRDIPSGTIVGDANTMSHIINDINYSLSRQLSSHKPIEDMTYDDYQDMINRYCDAELYSKCTNVVQTHVQHTTISYIETIKNIAKGEELSKIYSVGFWLNEHLAYLVNKRDRSVMERDHPLIRCILDRNDPLSVRMFHSVRSTHGLVD